MTRCEIEKIVAQMTLEEKASLCSGEDFWHTKAVERLGVPRIMVSDGPHGLRKQKDEADVSEMNDSITAVCYPAGCASAASFDRNLLHKMGEAIGESCQAEGVSVILGPAVNIKRSPLCGRNFEYYSEDPYLAGEIATSFIKGVQSQNVGTSIKHYMANSQENRRLTSDSRIDERTMREIYMPAFETAVKESKPWTVMCSYNKINGIYAAEHDYLLTKVLRDEWGFDGFVVSDWGAVNERVAGVKAGLDLEMPSSCGVNDKLIVEAVKSGKLDETVLNETVCRILDIVYRFVENRDNTAVFDRDEQHALSREVAEGSLVLLKNEGILPLKKEQKVAFIGQYAQNPRYQGGGSSHIKSYRVTGAWEFAKDLPGATYAQGYDDKQDELDEKLLAEAVKAAQSAEVAVVFAGLPDSFESEGFDRAHMQMPDSQNRLIEAIAKVQPNIVVVLHNGSPVEMPWLSQVKGVLEAYLGGEAVGEAEYNILYGKVNPSGKLAESFPICLEDNPSYLYYGGEGDVVEYREGVFVGYRYYDKKKMEVLFPFGHGLSYTTFEYSNLKLDKDKMTDKEKLSVSVDVTNTGTVEGKEIVQLYVGNTKGVVIRPEKELRGFEKIELKPGETKTVTFTLGERAFAYFDMQMNDFCVESGEYNICIGSSSRDIRITAQVYVKGTKTQVKKYHLNTTIGEFMTNEKVAKELRPILHKSTLAMASDVTGDGGDAGMQEAMMNYTPLRGLVSFQNEPYLDFDMLQKIVDLANEE